MSQMGGGGAGGRKKCSIASEIRAAVQNVVQMVQEERGKKQTPDDGQRKLRGSR